MSAILVFHATNTGVLGMDEAYGLVMDGPLPERVLVFVGEEVRSLSTSQFVDMYWESL